MTPAKRGPAKDKAPPKRKAPFKKTGSGIEAHGTVSELRDHHDGSGNVRMSIKHGKPKTGGDGLFSTYPDESSFTIPAEAAKQFTHGSRVKVRVHPHTESKKRAPRQLLAD
jgi:hypothetical protein